MRMRFTFALATLFGCCLRLMATDEKPAGAPTEKETAPKPKDGAAPKPTEGGFRFTVPGPVIGRPGKQIQHTDVGGVRRITVTDVNEKIEIIETAGKGITVKQTKTKAGKTETVEVQAENLAALKIKSAEAAELYQRYAVVPGARVLIGGQMQMQLNPNRQFPRPLVVQEEDESQSALPRRIRFEIGDRKYEITDSAGPAIQMKITKMVDQKEETEEFRAESAAEFKLNHPEQFRIYEKYTGFSFP